MIYHITGRRRWIFANLDHPVRQFPVIKLLDKYERWRRVAKILKISKPAQLRLEWIIYYHDGHSAAETARHFGIARKTFYKWFALFDEDNLYSLRKLEDQSRAPHRVRQRAISPLQTQRIIALRRQYIRYGKIKLAKLYAQQYGEAISSWKIQKVIEQYRLYYHPKKAVQAARRRRQARAHQKKRITELQRLPWWKKRAGYIICLDTITLYVHQLKRYIFTAVDKYGKVAFAHMYVSKSTVNAQDFLLRLRYLMNGQVPRVGHDNGSEFEKFFKAACLALGIEQYWSRVKTPKDNPENERFNRTLEEEFIQMGNLTADPIEFNSRLTEWLIEYNFKRPHAALNYETPISYSHLSPMYSSCTKA